MKKEVELLDLCKQAEKVSDSRPLDDLARKQLEDAKNAFPSALRHKVIEGHRMQKEIRDEASEAGTCTCACCCC